MQYDDATTSISQIAGTTVYFKIVAKDKGNNLSGASNIVTCNIKDQAAEKRLFIGDSYSFELEQNYPNPFNPSTTIAYQIPSDSKVSLKVYDVLGKEVASLVDEYKSMGRYEVVFNAENLSNGMYIYQLKAGDYVSSKKLLLVK